MKPFYYLCDFPERKNVGKNFVTECPKCGKKHLYISKETGAFIVSTEVATSKESSKTSGKNAPTMTRHPQASEMENSLMALPETITLLVSASTASAEKEKPEAEIPHPRYP